MTARTVGGMSLFSAPLAVRLLVGVTAVAVPTVAIVTVVHQSGPDRTGVPAAAAPASPTSPADPTRSAPGAADPAGPPGIAGPAVGAPAAPVGSAIGRPIDAVRQSPPPAQAPPPVQTPPPVVVTPPAAPAAPAFPAAAAQSLAAAQVDLLAAKGMLAGPVTASAAVAATASTGPVTRADVAAALSGVLDQQRATWSSSGDSGADVRSWADTQVDTALHLGVLTDPGGALAADASITRTELAALFSGVLDGRLTTVDRAPAPAVFTDSQTQAYARATIERLAAAGVVADTGTFDPSSRITRQDFAVVMVQTLGLDNTGDVAGPRFSDVAVSTYADTLLTASVRAGLLRADGGNVFRPTEEVSTQTWAALLTRQLALTNNYLTGPVSGVPPIYTGPTDTPPTDTPPTDPAPPSTDIFTDIADSPAREAILALVDAGIISAAPGGQFNPEGWTSRQDAAIVLSKALHLDVSSPPSTATFSDVPTTHYAFAYVEAVVRAELMAGVGDGMFGMGTGVTREEMAVLLARALQLPPPPPGAAPFTDVAAPWAQEAIGALVNAGIMPAGGAFRPTDILTRGDLAVLVARALPLLPDPTVPPAGL